MVGGAFEKATAIEPRISWISQTGMDLLKLCREPEDYEAGGKFDVIGAFQCIGFIEGVAGTLGGQIFREELFQLGETPLPPRELCIPKDISRMELNIAIRGWLKNEFKTNGDLALRFGTSRNITRALLEVFPCKK